MMHNNDYLFPALAAIALAVLFPLYWLNETFAGTSGMGDALMTNFRSLSFSDLIFLATGILSIYVYLNLKKILNDRLNFQSLDVLIFLVLGVHVIFTATLGIDITVATLSEQSITNNEDTFLGIGLTVGIGSMILFGLLDILIAVVMLKNGEKLPTLLKIFAVITLIQGLFEITVVFSPVTLLTFPLSLIILAIYFLSKPDSIEVV